MWPGSGYEDWFLVEDAVFEHAVDHVASAAREADDGGVVALALFAFALVVGDGRRVFGGRDEQGLPQRVPEAFVAPSGGSLALDAGAGLAGGRSDAGVGGQVGRAFEVGDVAADAERDVACGPDAYPGHRRRDHEKRVVLQELLDLVPDLAPPILDGSDIPGDRGYDGLGHGGAGHGDGLLADGLEHVVDDAAGVRHDADLVLAAFAALRFPLDEIEVFHTDRGGEFTGGTHRTHARRVRHHTFPFQTRQPIRQRGGRIHQPARQEGTHPQERLHERGATTLGRQPVRVVVQPPTAPLDPRVPEPRGVHTTRKNPLETVQHTVANPHGLQSVRRPIPVPGVNPGEDVASEMHHAPLVAGARQ